LCFLCSDLNCSDGGGGGERVLWHAIQALVEARQKIGKDNFQIVIYSGDVGVRQEDIINRAKVRNFGSVSGC
jgi:hypothetical protein